MVDLLLAAAYAAVVWWFTTGIILVLDGLPRRTFRWSMGGATGILFGAAYALRASAAEPTAAGAYASFSAAILIWGWLEMSFLMGFITGPRKHACQDHCRRGHFWHATQAILYNEIATLAGAAAVATVTWQAPNRTGLWTYLVLWTMRLSAKLNLFLGVRNLGDKFLPPHLLYLKSFFKRRQMNFLFPFSVTGGTLVAVVLFRRMIGSPDGFQATSYALVTTLLVLAVLEHWFMMLPWSGEKLWNWSFALIDRKIPGRIPVKAPSA
jgi:putative photosynthetic complex assembly protein 2